MKRLLLLVLLALAAWYGWPLPTPQVESAPSVVEMPSVDILAAPIQRNLRAGPRFRIHGLRAQALAEYAISGRVLAVSRYRLGRTAGLAPFDLALGWARMSEPAVIKQLKIRQGGRWYFWRYEGAPPLPPRQIETSSANVHIVPANDVVTRALRRVGAGQRITLSGYLIELRADDGWRWRSSLSREDTGDGSCELLFAQTLAIE